MGKSLLQRNSLIPDVICACSISQIDSLNQWFVDTSLYTVQWTQNILCLIPNQIHCTALKNILKKTSELFGIWMSFETEPNSQLDMCCLCTTLNIQGPYSGISFIHIFICVLLLFWFCKETLLIWWSFHGCVYHTRSL